MLLQFPLSKRLIHSWEIFHPGNLVSGVLFLEVEQILLRFLSINTSAASWEVYICTYYGIFTFLSDVRPYDKRKTLNSISYWRDSSNQLQILINLRNLLLSYIFCKKSYRSTVFFYFYFQIKRNNNLVFVGLELLAGIPRERHKNKKVRFFEL